MRFTLVDYAGEFGSAPQQFADLLGEAEMRVSLTEQLGYSHFKPAVQVAFTQNRLADSRVQRWQALILTALESSNVVACSIDAPVLMVLPFLDTKFTQMQSQLTDTVLNILPAWAAHPNTQCYMLGSAGLYQALRQADSLFNAGLKQVVIGAVDSWATEEGIMKFVSQFNDYESVVLPASEGAVFVVLSRPSQAIQGIEVFGCGLDVVIERDSPSGLISLVADISTKQVKPMQYVSMGYTGDVSLDQVAHNTLSSISGIYDANTQFISPQIKQGEVGACYSLLQFLIAYQKFENKIWQGNCLQIDSTSLPYVGAMRLRWFD